MIDRFSWIEMLAGYPVAAWGNVLATATTHAYDDIVAIVTVMRVPALEYSSINLA